MNKKSNSIKKIAILGVIILIVAFPVYMLTKDIINKESKGNLTDLESSVLCWNKIAERNPGKIVGEIMPTLNSQERDCANNYFTALSNSRQKLADLNKKDTPLTSDKKIDRSVSENEEILEIVSAKRNGAEQIDAIKCWALLATRINKNENTEKYSYFKRNYNNILNEISVVNDKKLSCLTKKSDGQLTSSENNLCELVSNSEFYKISKYAFSEVEKAFTVKDEKIFKDFSASCDFLNEPFD